MARCLAITSLISLLLYQVHAASVQTRQVEIDVTHHAQCHRKTRAGDRISVHYNGTLEDGTLFDSSYGRAAPITFDLGLGQVIAGWDQGLVDMCIGEERLLTIPSSLAYGNRAVGIIPAESTLIFQTLLVAIAGVEAERISEEEEEAVNTGEGPGDDWQGNNEQDSDHEKAGEFSIQTVPAIGPAMTHAATTAAPTLNVAEAVPTQQPISPPSPEPDRPSNGEEDGDYDDDTGECRLLGPFALFVQGGLGILAISSLVWKRYRERPRRPFKVWFFDVSKQVFGSALLHVLNLFMSMLAAANIELAQQVQMLGSQFTTDATEVNPCSWYLINIAIDTTIGIPILVIFLRLLYHAFALTPLARPLEAIKSGHYGQPPRAKWWLKQSLIYFIGLVLMKLCVFFIIQILPWIARVGDWALRWTEGSEALQVTFVMFVFPLIMNALQYYIVDSFIKDTSDAHETVASDDASSGTQPAYHSIDARDSMESNDVEHGGETAKDEEEENGNLFSSGSESDPRRMSKDFPKKHI